MNIGTIFRKHHDIVTPTALKNRLHRCANCGHLMEIKTNHLMGCKAYCPSCSLKPTLSADGKIYTPALGRPPYREFNCMEEYPVTVSSEESWRKVRPWWQGGKLMSRLEGVTFVQ